MKKIPILLTLIFCLILGSDVFAQAVKEQVEIVVKFKGQEPVLKKIEASELDAELSRLSNIDAVEYAEENFYYRTSIIPSDSFFGNQWYLKRLRAPEAWDLSRGDGTLVLAVIDTGIQLSHPDLKDNLWQNAGEIPGNGLDDDNNGYIDDYHGWDFIANDNDPSPDFSGDYNSGILHGTIVAGVAAAAGNNATGISGINWHLRIMPLKALSDKGQGSTYSISQAIKYAVKNGADIINFSFVGENKSVSLEAEIRNAYEAGLIMVAAAGNDEGHGKTLDEVPLYPACYDGKPGENMVIGVASTDPLDQKSAFSSFGNLCVDISAPGESIFSTTVYAPGKILDGQELNSYYDGYWAGTSLASPMVAGAIALVAETDKSLRREQAISLILGSADNIFRLNPGYFGQLGSGRLNVFSAVDQAYGGLSGKNDRLIVSPESGKPSDISIRTASGQSLKNIAAYSANFQGGVFTASGDLDGDGRDEIITGAGKGGGPHVRIFGQDGTVKKQFFAYNENFRGGVNVASGDLDGDGRDEIITGAGKGGGPHVRIFDIEGNLISHFFAYNENFRGGVNVASGDLDGDGRDEIITGAGKGGGPHVRVFDLKGQVLGQFFAYNENFRGGVKVAAAKIVPGPRESGWQIVTAPGEGMASDIRIWKGRGQLLGEFRAFNEKFQGGANVSPIDLDNDGLDELAIAAAGGGGPHVKIFNQKNELVKSFYAFEPDFTGGVNLGMLNFR